MPVSSGFISLPRALQVERGGTDIYAQCVPASRGISFVDTYVKCSAVRWVATSGVEIFIGSKIQCMFWFYICNAEGIGGVKGGNANFKTKHTEPLTQEITSPLYNCPVG